ncbi:MAG: lipoate--protein ligase family protein [Thermacetogeniaceae bacterium]
MDFYDLAGIDWWSTQCYYHALAYLGREGLIICYPTSPYVCLGLHDDLEQEIDRSYCEVRGLPLLRRETGGGVVYLDSNQIFFQLVLRRDNPALPLRRQRLYEKFLKPAIKVYRLYGLPAELREPADIVVGGSKCSGSASGDVGECVAYTGNILLDFDFDLMSGLLRVPGPDFRACLKTVMRQHMTTLADWLPELPPRSRLSAALAAGFAEEFGPLTQRLPDEELRAEAGRLQARLTGQSWLHLLGRRRLQRKIKIAEGVYLMERSHTSGESGIALLRGGRMASLSDCLDLLADGDLPPIHNTGSRRPDALPAEA